MTVRTGPPGRSRLLFSPGFYRKHARLPAWLHLRVKAQTGWQAWLLPEDRDIETAAAIATGWVIRSG